MSSWRPATHGPVSRAGCDSRRRCAANHRSRQRGRGGARRGDVRRARDRAATRLDLDHGPDGPDAESALIDAWRALGPETTGRVRCAIGPLAGVLLRAGRRRAGAHRRGGPAGRLRPRPRPRSGAERPQPVAAGLRGAGFMGAGTVAPNRPSMPAGGGPAYAPPSSWDGPFSGRTARRPSIRSPMVGWTPSWRQRAACRRAPPPGRPWRERSRHRPDRKPPPRCSLAGTAGCSWPRTRTIPTGSSSANGRSRPTSSMRGNEGRANARRGWRRRGARLIQLIGPAPQAVHAADLPDPLTLST